MSGNSDEGPIGDFPKEGEPEYAAYEARMEDLRASLMWGFLKLLQRAFPERYCLDDDSPVASYGQLLIDIKYVSGYQLTHLCTDKPATKEYKDWETAFVDFGKTHQMDKDPCVCFHGSSYASVTKIYEKGFNPALCREGAYGGGAERPCAYVSQYLDEALMYARLDEIDTLWVVYGDAHLGDPSKIPIGSKGQTDFGVHADGRPIVTLRNPSASYWCLGDPQRQFISKGKLGFLIMLDERPSDFALLHVMYPPAVWKRMTEAIPGLVKYKQGVVAKFERERRKAHSLAAWAAQVGRRQQPPRSAKRSKLGE